MTKQDAIRIVVAGSVLFVLARLLADQDPTGILLGGAALVALVLLVVLVGRARAAGDLDASAALTFAMGWLLSLPIVVVVLSGGLVRQLDPNRELVPLLPDWYEPAAYLSLAALMALAGALIVKRLITDGRRVPVQTAGLLAIVLWAVAWLASGLQGDRLLSLSGVTLLVCLIAATMLPRGRGACVGVGLFGLSLAIASGLMAAVQFDTATVPCRHTCVLGAALTGVLPNENLLGTTLLATLPFAYLGFRGRLRFWAVLYLAAMAFTTGSRGAMVIAFIVVVALLVVRPRLDADGPTPARTAIAGALLAGAMFSSLYVGQHDWGATDSLDDRPQLWNVASAYVAESPLFGYGPDRWETLNAETGEIARTAQHSTHNQWVDVLFNAGWIGAALMVAMVVAMIRSAGYARSAVLLALATIFLIGIAERAWNIGTADFVSFSLVALILLGPDRAEARVGARERPGGARARHLVPVPAG